MIDNNALNAAMLTMLGKLNIMAGSSTSVTPSTVVTVRGLSPELKGKLRIRAAHNARSMEAEARIILETALAAPEEDPTDLAAFARGLFGPLGGVDLELPTREAMREQPSLLEPSAVPASGAGATVPPPSEPDTRAGPGPARLMRRTPGVPRS